MTSLKNTYDKISEDWVKDHNIDTWWIEGTDHFISLLPKGSTILDVGCGGGIKSKYISDKGYKVLGIDFSEKMIEIAKRHYPGIDFLVMDMYELNKIDNKYDAVFAQASLLHIKKSGAHEVLKNMYNLLNQNGLLYISVKSIREDGVEESIRKENDYGYEYERYFSYYSMDELKNYYNKLGLEILWDGGKISEQTKWLQIIGKKN